MERPSMPTASCRSLRTDPSRAGPRIASVIPSLSCIRGEGNGRKAVHLQLSAVWLGQLPERVAVPGPRPGDQVGCRFAHPRVTLFPHLVALPVWTPAEGRRGRLAGASFSTSRCLHQW
jgi:hypothetical protein